ncbi:MAG: multicopper oxidase domain-containing protein, partial [Planctomycetota bacterium]
VLGSLEVCHLVNRSGGWWHPIHIHLESHQQIQVKFDGTLRRLRPTDPEKLKNLPADAPENLQPHDQYKHDTALLGPNTEIIILMRFRTFLGPFVFHCHNLNHEDMRMMTSFDPRLESLGPEPVDSEDEPEARVVIEKPLVPEKIVEDQIHNKYLPIPAPTNVQQMFGDEV